MVENLKDWLVLGGLIAVALGGIGWFVGSYRRGKSDSFAASEQAASVALAAQQAQIQVQDQTIASLRYELSAMREEMTVKSTKCTEDIALLQAQMAVLETELVSTRATNAELNQMPPKDVLAALAADAAMNITEHIGERLHMLEQGMTRLLAEPARSSPEGET